MPSLQLPKDLDVLRLCQQPRTRYELSKHFGNGYQTTIDYMERLEQLDLVFVVEETVYRPGKMKKKYLITAKGRAVLRGHEEAERR